MSLRPKAPENLRLTRLIDEQYTAAHQGVQAMKA